MPVEPETMTHAVGRAPAAEPLVGVAPLQLPGKAFSSDELASEKRNLKILLSHYETQFLAETGRKPSRDERARDKGTEYRRYAELKVLLEATTQTDSFCSACSPMEHSPRRN